MSKNLKQLVLSSLLFLLAFTNLHANAALQKSKSKKTTDTFIRCAQSKEQHLNLYFSPPHDSQRNSLSQGIPNLTDLEEIEEKFSSRQNSRNCLNNLPSFFYIHISNTSSQKRKVHPFSYYPISGIKSLRLYAKYQVFII
jgi:hypothetical protein